MKRIWISAIALAIFIVGCGGGDLKGKIVGNWKFDATTAAGPGMTDEMKKGLAAVMADASITFKEDGTYSGTGMGSSGNGKWSLADHTLKVTPDKGGNPKSDPTFTVSDDGSKIHMAAPIPSGTMTLDLIKSK
jgi:hypothetical protein